MCINPPAGNIGSGFQTFWGGAKGGTSLPCEAGTGEGSDKGSSAMLLSWSQRVAVSWPPCPPLGMMGRP
eukprot:1366335-Rhodomonas_salina.1